ncbi:TonB-dependent receptor [Lysobacter sp. A378]
MNDQIYLRALVVAVAAALSSMPVQAQQAAEEAASQAVQLDNVTVTAQRREEQVQDTPVVISVFNAEDLKRKQVSRVDDLKFHVPNITIDQNTSTSSGAKIFLRGVGQDESMFTADPAVAIYIDDVYIPRQNGSMFDLYDVERIEVLRGPQGTLYGRNATGGAIRYITRKPMGDERLEVDGTLGNFGRADMRVMYNTRLGETIDFSAAALTRNRDGFIHEQVSGKDVNDSKVTAGRVGFSMPVAENSYASLNIDRLRERSSPTYAVPVALVDGQTVPRLENLYTTRSDLVGGINDLDQFGAAFTFETYYDKFLWRHIAHYRSMDSTIYVDVDGTDQLLYHLFQDQEQSQYGYESQLISQGDGPLTWVAGVFGFREQNEQPTRNDIFGIGGVYDIAQDTTALAAYAQATYAVSDRLNLTAGGRFSNEKKDLSVLARDPAGNETFRVTRNGRWSKPDWKLMADYDLSANVMAFATISTGFKSGGFNGRGTTPETITPFDEETVRSYETGIKSTLFDNRVRLNATYYRNDYGGLQLSAIDPNGIYVTTNATGALIQGVEVEVQAQLTDNWNVNANIGTIDAEYRDYAEINRETFEGRDLKQAPEMQWQIGTTYVQPIADAQLIFNVQVVRTDMFYQNQDLSELVKTPANTQANARIAYEPDHGNWSVAAWGRNLTDQQISAGGFDIPGLGVAVIYPTLPRTYGVDFKYRFW